MYLVLEKSSGQVCLKDGRTDDMGQSRNQPPKSVGPKRKNGDFLDAYSKFGIEFSNVADS